MVVKLIRWSVFFSLALATPALLSAAPVSKKSGIIKKGCQTLGEVKLCFGRVDENISQGMSLLVGGKRTEVVIGGWDVLPYEMERRNGVYRLKVDHPSPAITEFFYFDEISFRKVGSHYLATEAVIASSHECDGLPDSRRIDRIDFRRGTITTIAEPAYTANGKQWQYIHPIKLKTSDIHRLSFGGLAEFLADTPATQRLCDIYG